MKQVEVGAGLRLGAVTPTPTTGDEERNVITPSQDENSARRRPL